MLNLNNNDNSVHYLYLLQKPHSRGCRTYSHSVRYYSLVIYVEVPETSGLDISILSSPVVTLGRYRGLSSDSQAPEWTRLPTGISFEIRQPRTAIADVFMEIAFWPENTVIVRTLTSHCNHSMYHSYAHPERLISHHDRLG
jgi:hypothetical protein